VIAAWRGGRVMPRLRLPTEGHRLDRRAGRPTAPAPRRRRWGTLPSWPRSILAFFAIATSAEIASALRRL